jgi:hypothetical protein
VTKIKGQLDWASSLFGTTPSFVLRILLFSLGLRMQRFFAKGCASAFLLNPRRGWRRLATGESANPWIGCGSGTNPRSG